MYAETRNWDASVATQYIPHLELSLMCLPSASYDRVVGEIRSPSMLRTRHHQKAWLAQREDWRTSPYMDNPLRYLILEVPHLRRYTIEPNQRGLSASVIEHEGNQ